jgi:formate dehydrogenase major subunit
VNPLRGQNNVQGACDMGAYPNVFSGYQKCEVAENRAKMEKAWGVTGLPDWYGVTLTEQITQCGDPIKAMYILGLNPVVTYGLQPCKASLGQADFLVIQTFSGPRAASTQTSYYPAPLAEKDGPSRAASGASTVSARPSPTGRCQGRLGRSSSCWLRRWA